MIMPTLSKLLQAREDLQKLTPGLARDSDLSLLDTLDNIRNNIKAGHLLVNDVRKSVIEKHLLIFELIENFNDTIEKEIQSSEILYRTHNDKRVKSLINHSYDEWQEYMRLIYGADDEFDQITDDRIAANSNWQRPALFFMPDTLRYLDRFNSSYPIYILSDWREISETIKNTVPVQQNRKIRSYMQDQQNLLPRDCMGFILARNYYTHKDMQTLIEDLKLFVELLGPAGTVAFNFNNCEISKSAANFENKTRSFMLGTEVRREIWKAGLNITKWQYIDSVATTWVEATKAGEFKSVRKDEAMGMIMEIKKSKKKI